MRVPFWDWMLYPTLPEVVTNSTLSINTPDGEQKIDNPLLQYSFPVNMLKSGYFPSDRNVSVLTTTVRSYDPITRQSNQTAASVTLAGESARLIQRAKNLFNNSPNYTFFASYSAGAGASLEAIHGDVHNAIGGEGPWAGHMTIIPMSSYDPVFWLHHANIDRLLAIFQAMYPDNYVEPSLNTLGTYYQPADQFDTVDTPLAPFHEGNGSMMWTAATARDTAKFGYTYPEISDWNVNATMLAVHVREIFNALYGPP